MIRGFCYFMLFLAVLWLLQGFGSFLVDMWPVIKWMILVGAAFFLFKSLGFLGKKKQEPGPETINVDPNGNAEVNND